LLYHQFSALPVQPISCYPFILEIVIFAKTILRNFRFERYVLMQVSEKKVEIYVSYLRGRLNYDAKKAARLGFFTIHDYVRDTLTREAEALEKLLQVTLTKTRI